MDLRQGPWWTKFTFLFSGWVHVHRVHACMASEGSLPCFLAGMFPSATCSPTSYRNGLGIQLRWGKASLRHGNYNGGVRATDGAS